MPTYEYECLNCRERFEVFQKITEEPIQNCIKCNGAIKRLISGGSGLIFKGTGFYITDYKHEAKTDSKKEPENLKKEQKSDTKVKKD